MGNGLLKHEHSLGTVTDMKIFILFLMDNIGYTMDYTTLSKIAAENLDDYNISFSECMEGLVDSGHLISDEAEGERFSMISDKGRKVAAQLYDTLGPSLRERSLRCAIKHISLSRRGAEVHATVTPRESGGYEVTMAATDAAGCIMSATLTVNSLTEANRIKQNYEAKPDAVYRGIFFAATGRMEYLF